MEIWVNKVSEIEEAVAQGYNTIIISPTGKNKWMSKEDRSLLFEYIADYGDVADFIIETYVPMEYEWFKNNTGLNVNLLKEEEERSMSKKVLVIVEGKLVKEMVLQDNDGDFDGKIAFLHELYGEDADIQVFDIELSSGNVEEDVEDGIKPDAFSEAKAKGKEAFTTLKQQVEKVDTDKLKAKTKNGAIKGLNVLKGLTEKALAKLEDNNKED